MRNLRSVYPALPFLLCVASCETQAPPEVDYGAQQAPTTPIAAFDDRLPEVIVVDEDGTATLSGQVKNWLTLEYVDGIDVSTVGLTPEVRSSSAAPQGRYVLEGVQVAGVFWVKTSGGTALATHAYVRMPQGDYLDKTVYALTTEDMGELLAAYDVTALPGCGTVVGEVKGLANLGQAGVAGITLQGVDADGPYFLSGVGIASAGEAATTASGKFVFFNVCSSGKQTADPGTTALLTVDDPGYQVITPAYVNIYAAGVTHGAIQVAESDEPAPAPVTAPPPDEPIDFTTNVHPILVREACGACHSPGGSAESTGLYFAGTAREVYDDLLANVAWVDREYPQRSLLLTKPLYEDPPNHPNASFPSALHPDYLTLLNWILQGAPFGEPPPTADAGPVPGDNVDAGGDPRVDAGPSPDGGVDAGGDPVIDAGVDGGTPSLTFPVGVDFYADVQPRFAQRTCTQCHNNQSNAGGLDLTGKPYDVYQRLNDPAHQRVVATQYTASSLFTKPHTGYLAVVHNGGKPIDGDADPFAQYIGGWIDQGASAPLQTPLTSATADLAPFFAARGCTGCHAGNGASGGLRLDLTGADLVKELTGTYDDNQVRVLPNDPAGSSLITKVWDIYDTNHGGGKTSLQTYYKDYHRIVTWIFEGATAP